jgi:hypothetical protein
MEHGATGPTKEATEEHVEAQDNEDEREGPDGQ